MQNYANLKETCTEISFFLPQFAYKNLTTNLHNFCKDIATYFPLGLFTGKLVFSTVLLSDELVYLVRGLETNY